jgi:ribosomal protein S14
VSELLINLLFLAVVLGGSALITQWFTTKMYNRCSRCGGLNAKRRSQCRLCGNPL